MAVCDVLTRKWIKTWVVKNNYLRLANTLYEITDSLTDWLPDIFPMCDPHQRCTWMKSNDIEYAE